MVICKKSCTFWIQFIIANKNISSTSNLYLDLSKSSFIQNQDKLRNEPIIRTYIDIVLYERLPIHKSKNSSKIVYLVQVDLLYKIYELI